ncbi:NRAMP family divalent metal transporter [Sphingomonas segetis]|uniref:NRAMP family divalent metal transporter n=1 Tax=Sphingomonas segetis TaxID=1104779 RepID=UPI001E5EEF84|nr:divalent metal cation transporter [Sphingomonas segetis]
MNRPRRPHTLSGRAVRAVEDIGSVLGPGVVTGAADDDPSGIATYSQAGAQFGYGLLWTQLLSYPLMVAVQLVCAHIGRVTGSGLAHAMTRCFPRFAVTLLVGILLVANVINLGADLTAMGAAAALVVGGGRHLFVIAFALLTVGLLLFVSYARYANVLKWLTFSLFAYVGVILLVRIDWNQALLGLVWPRHFGKDGLLTIVALFGTTISPYLFFWQSSQEAEDLAAEHRRPLSRAPRSAPRQFRRMRVDTIVGMGFSELIAMAIIITSAATLHVQGVTEVASAEQAAEALRPIAGQFAFALFALGIIGTGLLALPVLAGSAAFAVSEARGWKSGLERKPKQARAFYAIIVAAVAIGVLFDWSGVDPMRALFWSAALNGVCAVPIMVAMMIVAHRPAVMGRFTERWLLMSFGWAATAVMAVASAAMLVSFF